MNETPNSRTTRADRRSGAVEASAGNFGDNAVTAQLCDEAGDACTASTGLFVASGWVGVEAGSEVVVAEAVDSAGAGQDGGEEGAVGGAEGVEPGVVTAISARSSPRG
jgi:hypothetical protein